MSEEGKVYKRLYDAADNEKPISEKTGAALLWEISRLRQIEKKKTAALKDTDIGRQLREIAAVLRISKDEGSLLLTIWRHFRGEINVLKLAVSFQGIAIIILAITLIRHIAT